MMGSVGTGKDYVTRVLAGPAAIDPRAWNRLLEQQDAGAACGPFVRHEYLAALHHSASAVPDTGWSPQWVTLWQDKELRAAAPLYVKPHSYGEYVFDWTWASAYKSHGIDYYPKGVVAVPFTPVPGPRLLACDAQDRLALAKTLIGHCQATGLSSLHILFANRQDMLACNASGMLQRQTVQFHWCNAVPGSSAPFPDFEHFLSSLNQEKRKKIRQERRKVSDAGVSFHWLRGGDIGNSDWDFFYRCYNRTYLEHGNHPYLRRPFFESMARDLPAHWLMFVATNAAGHRIACSLVALSDASDSPAAAYGRYWGALERVDCLHFEACYYQPLEWCIEHGVQRFEGGAQGEHKMARALMPVATHSAHWLSHPDFSQAVEHFLGREDAGVARYLDHLDQRTPFRRKV